MSNTMNAPKADGSAISMEDKVKSLRIKVDSTSGVKTKSQTFAWGLALIFMLVSLLMAWRSYKLLLRVAGWFRKIALKLLKWIP